MTTQAPTTADVLNSHLSAIVSKDIDAIVADYAEDAVVLTANGVFKGKDAIAEFFKNFVQVLTPEFLGAFEMTHQEIDGDVAFITWKSGDAAPLGTDTLICRDGLISIQTAAIYMPK